MGATRTFRVQFDCEKGTAAHVLGMRIHASIGRPTVATVEVGFEDPIAPEDVLGLGAVIGYGFEDTDQTVFDGLVSSLTAIGSPFDNNTLSTYSFSIASRTHFLGLNRATEIFQEMDVKAIISKVFEDNGIPSDRVEWRLNASYPKRTYTVQYGEGSLAFVRRLCEREGIFFFTERKPDGDGDVTIFSDDSSTAKKLEGGEKLAYRAGGMDTTEDAFQRVYIREAVRSGVVTLRDYDFEKPKLDLTNKAEVDTSKELEVYDYPGGYTVPAEGKRLAQMLLEAHQVERRQVTIDSDCPRLTIGRLVELADTGEMAADGEYFVFETIHDYREKAGGGGSGAFFRAAAKLVPKDTKFRLPCVTKRPIIAGPQTVEIMAPDGSPPETIHTDKYGRAKVRFHWDHLGPDFNDKASCWIRVTQPQTSGSMILPRVSWEAIVEYLDGDPDRPVITGKVYNGMIMPPYALPEGCTRTAIRTSSTPNGGGTNEIRLEDKSGGEEIMIHSQYDTSMKTANNKTKTVANNESLSVKVDSEETVGSNQDVKIAKGFNQEVGGDQSITVGAARKVEVNAVSGLTVGGSSSTTIGGAHKEMIGNPLEGLIAAALEIALEVAKAKIAEVLDKIEEKVQDKVDQVLKPIIAQTRMAEGVGLAMQGVANGDLGQVGNALGHANGMMNSLNQPPAEAGGGEAPAGGAPAAEPTAGETLAKPFEEAASTQTPLSNTLEAMQGTVGNVRGLADDAIDKALTTENLTKAAGALGDALGLGSSGGGGESGANANGPEGDVPGIDQTDRAKGPGHLTNKVAVDFTETVGALKLTGALAGIETNIGGAMTQTVGAASVSLSYGGYTEGAEGAKTQTTIGGLVVLAKGDESESSKMKTTLVGGAIAQKIAGGHTVEATTMATFISAFNKFEAATSITLKCGASEMVIDGSGITMTSPLVTVLSPKIQIPKSTTEI